MGDRVVRFERGHTVGHVDPQTLFTRRRVRLRGAIDGTTETRADGRTILRLDSVELEAHADVLAAFEQEIDLELRLPRGVTKEAEDA